MSQPQSQPQGSCSAEAVSKFLSENPDFLDRWLKDNRRLALTNDTERLQLPTADLLNSRGAPLRKRSTEGTDLSRLLRRPSPLPSGDEDDFSELEDASHRSVVPRTARKSVTRDLFQQWLSQPRSTSTVASRGHEIRTSLEILEQNDRLMELILDISNELDIDLLCHKILLNVGHLTKADRCSLLLARGPRENRYLEAKLFDVEATTSLEEALEKAAAEDITIPFGLGICGHVARSKEVTVLKDAYQDPRFNREQDERSGYRTRALVCMPICNYDGEVIGVIQIVNKKPSNPEEDEEDLHFSDADIKVFERYLKFCGIGIQNAQLFEVSILEYKKNQLLLSLARNLFQEQMSLERLVSTIILEAKQMLKCERCTVYLLDLKMYEEMQMDFLHHAIPVGQQQQQLLGSPTSSVPAITDQSSVGGCAGPSSVSAIEMETTSANREANVEALPGPKRVLLQLESEAAEMSFQHAWETQSGTGVYSTAQQEINKSRRAIIAKYVAASKEVLNLSNVADWLGQDTFEEADGFVPVNMLCVPIFNGQGEVIGVAQLINKNKGLKFTESDICLFEAFAIFCGIGIHNTKMYEGAVKLMAKQKVALDCLSYHASASDSDTESLSKALIPEAESFSLFSYKFNDMELSDSDTFKVVIRMFMEFGLIQQFQIPYKVLCRWVLSVKKNYRPVKYHNWRHGLNVCQTMFTVLKTGKMDRFMDDLEIFGLLVACLCHDLDHRGTNNAFQSKMDSPLAILYSTSTMEHHHFDQCVMILSSEGNNIFQGLSTEDYRRVMKIVEKAILSTDLALYFRKKDLFLETANKGEIDWQEKDKKDLLCGMLMTACDVSAIAKPWELQHRLAKRVADEFFDQGDMEKLRLNQQPIAMMDRERKDELPKMQVGFIDVVCRPLYTSLSESFPWIKPLLDGCLANREKWADLAEKVEMGLTWIDHDTIDKPVEEISEGTAEAKDIEFKIETLKCSNSGSSSGVTSVTSSGPNRRESMITKKRSLRSAKSPVGRASGFFTRRLSAKGHRSRKTPNPASSTPTSSASDAALKVQAIDVEGSKEGGEEISSMSSELSEP